MKIIITNNLRLKIASNKNRKISVPLFGIVKKTIDGFIYVKISNDVINGMFSMIDEDGIEKPPYNTNEMNNVGAHISLIHSDEFPKDDIFTDSGRKVSFKLGNFYSVKPDGWDEVKRVWFLEVESPDMESIRSKYGLSKKKDGHEFHLTIAVKYKD